MKNKTLKVLSLLGFLVLGSLVTYELIEPSGFFSRWTAGVYLKNFKMELAELLSQNSICSRTLRDRSGRSIVLSPARVALSSSEFFRLQNLIDRKFPEYQIELDSVWLTPYANDELPKPRVRYTSHSGILFIEGRYGGSQELKLSIKIPLELTTGPWEARSILDCSAAKTAVP